MSEVGRRRLLAGAGAAVAVSATGVLSGATAGADEQAIGLPPTTVKPGDSRYIDNQID